MRFLLRNSYWITLIWLIAVLVFFKFYNGFQFTNNESILFIVLLLIEPIINIIITKIYHFKDKKKYQNDINHFTK